LAFKVSRRDIEMELPVGIPGWIVKILVNDHMEHHTPGKSHPTGTCRTQKGPSVNLRTARVQLIETCIV
jgi:hypothetical protein